MLSSEQGLQEANARIADLQVNTEQNAKQLEVRRISHSSNVITFKDIYMFSLIFVFL